MRINTPEYRQWKKQQNDKNLLLRSKKRRVIRAIRTAQIEHNLKVKKTSAYNVQSRKHEFHAPLNFSFVSNPEETVDFFNKIIQFISNKKNYGKRIFIDISQISHLTNDALMYLLAIVNNLDNNFKNKCSFSGNVPDNGEVRKLFAESGFYQFVRHQGNTHLIRNNDTVQIMSGENCDTKLAKRLCDFVCEKAHISKRRCSFLYNIIIELMSNTHRHAYPDGQNILHTRWYCFAEFDGNQTVSISFMDTGAGIPSTVRKNFFEQIDILNIKGEYSYVVSALEGEFRTSTRKNYRGKGLPKIREFCLARKIKDMHILANRADVVIQGDKYISKDIPISFCGTLYYWDIDLLTIKEDFS